MPRPLNIAIVEDNPHDVLLMKEFLKDSGIGYRLNVLEDGESAINYVRELSLRPERVPDLMFLDLNLPRRNGHEVLKELRSHAVLNTLKVIILTTSENPEDQRLAFANGADCYLTKPPAFENLWHVLEVIETAWLNIAAIPDGRDHDSTDVPKAFETQTSSSGLAESSPERAIESKVNLLFIEDNRNDLLLIQELLQVKGANDYDVCVATDLSTAQQSLKSARFDVVMTDLGLPDARGLAVLDGLKDFAAETPIIILTGLDDETLAQEALARGAQDYLVKEGIDEKSLTRSIRYALVRYQAERAARQKLATERDLLQQLLEGTPVSIARFDSHGHVLNSNSAFQNNFSCTHARNESTSIKQLLPEIKEEQWDQLITRGMPFRLDGTYVRRAAQSNECAYDIFVWATLNREQSIDGGIVMAVDVTDRLNSERHRHEFIAELAHDIKNPLVGANKVLEALIDGSQGKMDNTHVQLLDAIRNSNDSLLTMLRNVLDAYRFDTAGVALSRETIDFAFVAGAAAASVIPMARAHGVLLQVQVSDQIPKVRGDSMAIQRMLTNLLHNAIKFSHPGGKVRLTVEADATQKVVVSVSDNGVGISPLEQEYLFRRFGQGRSKYYKQGAGTGIGLYLCKKIAEAHNGSISCKSHLEEGTTFEVTLPAEVLSVCA